MKRIIALLLTSIAAIALLSQQGYLNSFFSSASAEAGESTQPIFVDVSWPAGIRDTRRAGIDMAAGQAWGDYDNDGWVDLYVTDPIGPNTLYRNNGDGTFSVSPLSERVQLAADYSGGATFADYDNDGWRDLYVTNWGQDRLFRNDRGLAFIDVTAAAGIVEQGHTKTASWGDYDQDGDLDLYLANWSCYPKCGRPMDGESDRLYRNNADGTFTNVSDYLGGSMNGAGFVASFHDFDNDGDLDIYLVNDEFVNPIGNKLWRNDGPGCKGWCFKQIASQAGADSRLFGMGLAVGDYDNDGDLDYYYSNVGPMELLQNQGDGTFKEVAQLAGVQMPNGIGWGTVFIDYDNDGWRDLYLAVADTTNHRDIGANQLYRNNRDGTFTLENCNNEAADIHMSLGVAYADYNQDGWVDLLVGNTDEGYRLYENRLGKSNNVGIPNVNNWLALELTGGGPVNRDAVGARATITTPDGVTQIQEIINGTSMGAGNELTLYFGLGKNQSAAVTIRWPDGVHQTFENVSADQRYGLTYPTTGESSLVRINRAAPAIMAGAIPLRPAALAQNFQRFLNTPMGALALFSALLLQVAVIVVWALRTSHKAAGLILAGLLALAGSAALFWTNHWLQSNLGPLDRRLALHMQAAGVQPLTSPPAPSQAVLALGEALFWDPELSGNRDTSCATCHHPNLGTGDNLSLSIGTGGLGLGLDRLRSEERREFIPRNAPPIYNLGYTEWTVFFWDGRLNGTPQTGFHSPASDRLLPGLDSLLAAQAMFPVTSRDEMRGLRGDKDIFGQPNELAMLPDYTSRPVWEGVMQRLLAIPAYVDLFQAAYPGIAPADLTFVQAANALAAYQAGTFTFEDSPYDRYIRGDRRALTPEQKRGALLFYGSAGCSSCHSGGLLTDQRFYNLAVPQFGPGKGREQPFDLGRARETGSDCDRYSFRTPPLRNVAITGPWMHNGAFARLEDAVRHHFSPAAGLQNYDPAQLLPVALQVTCQEDPQVLAAILSTLSESASQDISLSDAEFYDLMAFLHSLTSPAALDLEHTIPSGVPSSLSVGGSIRNPAAHSPAKQSPPEQSAPPAGQPVRTAP